MRKGKLEIILQVRQKSPGKPKEPFKRALEKPKEKSAGKEPSSQEAFRGAESCRCGQKSPGKERFKRAL